MAPAGKHVLSCLTICLLLAFIAVAGCTRYATDSSSQEPASSAISSDAASASDLSTASSVKSSQESAGATSEPIGSPSTSPTSTAGAETSSLSGYVVCIDAGHQAQGDSRQEPIGPGSSTTKNRTASGTSSVTTGKGEYAVNLEVALKLQKELLERGVSVIMTRTTNDVIISNSERAQIANDAHADLAIHLHCDGAESGSPTGFSTLVPAKNQWTADIYEESARAGSIIQRTVCDEVGCNDRGVVERDDLTGLNWSDVPAVYVEMGFLSTASEDRLLLSESYQQELAYAMADGIVAYLLG